MLACERHSRDDIVCAAAADDHGGAPVDHAVPDGASVVVGLVAGDEDVSPDRAPQLLENRPVQASGVGIRCFVSTAHDAPLSNHGLTARANRLSPIKSGPSTPGVCVRVGSQAQHGMARSGYGAY